MEPINVDFIINNEQVKADSQKVKQDITGVDQTAEKSAKRVSQTVKRVYDNNVKEVDEYTKAVARSSKTTAAMGNTAAATKPKFNGLQNSINQLSREAPAFAVSAQTGFLALSNNIPILADEIQRLKVENQQLVASGQKGVPIWKQITKSLFSFGTALSLGVTLITIYGREIGEFIGRLFKGKGTIDSLKESQEALNKAFESTDYQNAIKDVLSLETNIDLAKRGMIDAKDVVEQYNESLGKATGSVEDLKGVEELMIANSDKYIQMMLYKSAANIALDEAAKEAYKSELRKMELQEEIAEQEAAFAKVASSATSSDAIINAQRERAKNLRKAYSEYNKEVERAVEDRNQIFKKLQERAASFGLNMFLDDDDKAGTKDKGDNGLKARQRLLDRIAALDKEYARKRMDDDEAEVQALRDKFAKIRTLIERFNKANPTIAINIDQLDAIGAQAEADLIGRQEQEALEKIRKEAEASREEYEKQWAKQLEDLKSYEMNRNDMIEEYQKLRNKLVTQGYDERAKELDRQHQAELGALDDAQLKKLQSYKDLFDGINGLSIKAGKEIIANAKALIESQRMSAEAKAEILKKIAEAEAIIQTTQLDNIYKISEAFFELGASLENLGESVDSAGLTQAGGALSGLASNMRNILTAFDDQAGTTDKIAAGISSISSLITMLANASRERKEAERDYYLSVIGFQNDYNLALQDQIRLQGMLNDSAFLTDYEGRITSGVEALRNANSEYQKAFADLADAQVKIGQNDKIDWGNVGAGASAGAGAGAAIGSIIPGLGTAIGAGIGALVGGAVGLFGGKETVDEFGSLLAEYPEIISTSADGLQSINRELAQSLIANGMVNEETQAILENIMAWEDAIQEARDQIREVISELAGGLGDDLRNSLVEAFKAGEDAAVAMGESIEKVLENVLSQLIFNQIFSSAFEDLEARMADSFDIGGDQDWLDDFAAFFNQASGLTDDFNQALTDAQKEAADFGFDIFNQDSEGAEGLKGAIRREMTEETASELTGLYRATFDVQKRHLRLSEDLYRVNASNMRFTMNIMQTNALIERHTANTVLELQAAVGFLKKIKDNTKDQSGRDIGVS